MGISGGLDSTLALLVTVATFDTLGLDRKGIIGVTMPGFGTSNTTKGLETNRRGCFVADENGMTSREGVFAGGDAVTGAATVILAMGAGKKAAAAMDEYMKNNA